MTRLACLLRFPLRCIVPVLVLSCVAACQGQDAGTRIDPDAYPHARIVDQIDVFHETQVADPYRWMEDLDSEELMTWLASQDSLLKTILPQEGQIDGLVEQITAWRERETMRPPLLRGPWLFTFFADPGQSVVNLHVASRDGKPPGRLLVDANAARMQNEYVGTGRISPQGTWVPVLSSDGPTRWRNLRLLRTENREWAAETLSGVVAGAPLAWLPDESGFFYPRHDIPDNPQAPLSKPRIHFHRIGTDQEADPFIWEQPDGNELTIALQTTSDGRYLVLEGSASGGTFSGVNERLYIMSLQEFERDRTATRPGARPAVRELFASNAAQLAYEGTYGDLLLIRTTDQAENMRIVAVDPESGIGNRRPTAVQTVVEEAEWPIQGVAEYENHLLVQYVRETTSFIRIFHKNGTFVTDVDVQATNIFGFNENPDSEIAWFGMGSLTNPGTIYSVNLEDDDPEADVFFQPKLLLDPSDFTSEVLFATSADGTQIPVSIVRHKDLKPGAEAPTFLYGYGAWAWAAFPWQQYMIPWLQNGGIYAVVHVRGGGEYGPEWHEAGIRQNRETWIADYVAAAEFLVQKGYTAPRQLVVNGGSASGMLPAIVANRHPELIGAVMIDYPFLDMVRMKEFGAGTSYIPEYGDPEIKDDFDVLVGYSPYHRIEPGRCYPPMLVQAGSEDETSTPMHAYKYVAALQAAQSCDNPVLLQITWGAGHSAGATAEQRARTHAEQLALLMQWVGLPPSTN